MQLLSKITEYGCCNGELDALYRGLTRMYHDTEPFPKNHRFYETLKEIL